jgi:type II secretory pathway component GspD/PulD (secretin)
VTRKAGAAALIALLAVALCGADDTVVEVLPVRNRPAESLARDLAPLAGPGGVVTASGERLIVRATPGALAQIKRLLAELDVAPRSLWITVRQAGASQAAARRTEVMGQATATGGRTRTIVSGAFAQQGGAGASADVQRLRALEGEPAFIRVARSAPLPAAGVVQTPQGPVVIQGTAFQEAESGLYVLPRLAGDVVTLEVATSKDAFNARGGVDTQRLTTTLTGRLGEWMTIGGISRSERSHAAGVAGGEAKTATDEQLVELLIEDAR